MQPGIQDPTGMDGHPIVEVQGITKKYGVVVAVEDVSLSLKKGEIVSLLGPSGCGKTTTLRIVAGLENTTKGDVLIDGRVVSSSTKRIFVPPEKRSVGMVFQSFALWPHMTVYENIAYCLTSRKFAKDVRNRKIRDYLEVVKLTGYEERYPSQLSGGQQQRVALARALAYEPKVLLMDEPLSNLDMKDRERVRVELRRILKGLGTSVLHVTHDQAESFVLADRVIVMNNGRIMQEGEPNEIYDRPRNLFVSQFIGRSNVFRATIERIDTTTARLFLDGTRIALRCNAAGLEITDGSTRYVTFRPNMIELSSSKPADREENVISGDAVEADYLGVSYEYKFAAEGLQFLVSQDKSRVSGSPVALGRAYLHVPEDSIYLLES